jgi:transposase-like protein
MTPEFKPKTMNFKSLCLAYNVSRTTLSRWLNTHSVVLGLKKNQKVLNPKQVLKIIEIFGEFE